VSTQLIKLIAPAAIPSEYLPFPEDALGMGITAKSTVIVQHSPRASDEFAFQSQMRQRWLWHNYFRDEIIPVVIPGTERPLRVTFNKDEHPRPELLWKAGLELPGIKEGGTVRLDKSLPGQNDGGGLCFDG